MARITGTTPADQGIAAARADAAAAAADARDGQPLTARERKMLTALEGMVDKTHKVRGFPHIFGPFLGAFVFAKDTIRDVRDSAGLNGDPDGASHAYNSKGERVFVSVPTD